MLFNLAGPRESRTCIRLSSGDHANAHFVVEFKRADQRKVDHLIFAVRFREAVTANQPRMEISNFRRPFDVLNEGSVRRPACLRGVSTSSCVPVLHHHLAIRLNRAMFFRPAMLLNALGPDRRLSYACSALEPTMARRRFPNSAPPTSAISSSRRTEVIMINPLPITWPARWFRRAAAISLSAYARLCRRQCRRSVSASGRPWPQTEPGFPARKQTAGDSGRGWSS